MKSKVLIIILLVLANHGLSQEYVLTDSTLAIEIPANEEIPKMTLTLGKNFLEAHKELREKYPDAKEFTYHIFIFAGPAAKYRIDLFKTVVDGNTLGFEGSLWRAKIISAMYGAKLGVHGELQYRASYTIPIKML